MAKIDKKFFNFRAPVAVCLFLLLGIFVGINLVIKSTVAIITLSVICCAVIAALVFKKSSAFISMHKVLAIICCLVFVVSAISIVVTLTDKKDADINNSKGYVLGTATVSRVVDNYLIVKNIEIGFCNSDWSGAGDFRDLSGSLLLVLGDERMGNFNVGDDVAFRGFALLKAPVVKGNLNKNYVLYESRGSCTIATGDIAKTGTTTSLDLFSNFRRSVKGLLDKNLSEDASGLAFAMLFGEDDDILDLYKDFSVIGIAHIIAVSGLNIMFLATLLIFLAKLFKMGRTSKFIFTLSITFIYVWMCGFVVSAVRAFIMSAVAMFASFRGKQYDPLNSLALAAIIILLVSPLQILSKGFQLSFCAVLGILLLSPFIVRNLKPILGQRVSGALGITMSATIFTLPIILQIYPEQSAISLFANIIVIPISSSAFIMTIICSIITAVLPFMSFVMVVPEALLSVMIWFAKTTARWSVFVVKFIPVNFIFGAIVILSALISDFVFVKKPTKYFSVGLLAIVFLIMIGIY